MKTYELGIEIGTAGPLVQIKFDHRVNFVQVSPSYAITMARELRKAAKSLERKDSKR